MYLTFYSFCRQITNNNANVWACITVMQATNLMHAIEDIFVRYICSESLTTA